MPNIKKFICGICVFLLLAILGQGCGSYSADSDRQGQHNDSTQSTIQLETDKTEEVTEETTGEAVFAYKGNRSNSSNYVYIIVDTTAMTVQRFTTRSDDVDEYEYEYSNDSSRTIYTKYMSYFFTENYESVTERHLSGRGRTKMTVTLNRVPLEDAEGVKQNKSGFHHWAIS